MHFCAAPRTGLHSSAQWEFPAPRSRSSTSSHSRTGFQVGCFHGEGEKKREVGSFPWQLHRNGGSLGNSGKVEAAGFPPPSRLFHHKDHKAIKTHAPEIEMFCLRSGIRKTYLEHIISIFSFSSIQWASSWKQLNWIIRSINLHLGICEPRSDPVIVQYLGLSHSNYWFCSNAEGSKSDFMKPPKKQGCWESGTKWVFLSLAGQELVLGLEAKH